MGSPPQRTVEKRGEDGSDKGGGGDREKEEGGEDGGCGG